MPSSQRYYNGKSASCCMRLIMKSTASNSLRLCHMINCCPFQYDPLDFFLQKAWCMSLSLLISFCRIRTQIFEQIFKQYKMSASLLLTYSSRWKCNLVILIPTHSVISEVFVTFLNTAKIQYVTGHSASAHSRCLICRSVHISLLQC